MRRLSALAILAAGLVSAAGCGDSGPRLFPVVGRVTLNGKPVREMLINFQPVGNTHGNGAHAMTDTDGRFTLSDMRGGEGAYAGEYKVSFYPALGTKQEIDPSIDVVNDGSKSGLPRLYLDADKSPLRVTIPEGGGTADVILTGSGKDAAIKFQPRGK
jgi:hypothetical protein